MPASDNGGHEQSIGDASDLPVDGIAGSHPGTQEPAGADVNAGKTRHGAAKPEGKAGSAPGAGSEQKPVDNAAHAGAPAGTLERGSLVQRDEQGN